MLDLTAQQVVERIQRNSGVPWNSTDAFEAGSADTKVIGIATTWAPSLDVLRRAPARGKNMIISRERPFWDRRASVARVICRDNSHAGGPGFESLRAHHSSALRQQKFVLVYS